MTAERQLSQPEIAGQAGRLTELEGLRGVLSWWVFVGHALLAAGLGVADLSRGVRILAHGDYAVDVFIILSGFVISKLLLERQLPYRKFLGQRFCRLYPAYLGVLLFSAALLPLFGTNAAILTRLNPVIGANAQINALNESQHFFPHLFAHLTMLHGVVPETILPGSAVALLPPAWSITLEWQFYLVAPFLLAWLAKSKAGRWLFVGLAVGLATLFADGILHQYYRMPAFLPMKALFFWIGIVSYKMWKDSGISRQLLGEILVCGVAPLVLCTTLSISLALWAAVLGATMAASGAGPSSWVSRFLCSAPMQHLGRISYSTYLVNAYCIFQFQWIIERLMPGLHPVPFLMLLFPSSALFTYIISFALHRFVEVPGIALGKRLF